MRQAFFAKNRSGLGWGNTPYIFPFAVNGYQGENTTGAAPKLVMPASGVIGNFLLTIPAALGSALNVIFSSVTLTIPAGSTSVTSSSTVSVTAGDVIQVEVPRLTPTSDFRLGFRFIGNNSNEAILMGNNGITSLTTSAYYSFPFSNRSQTSGNAPAATTTESQRYFYAPTNFTIKSFYIKQGFSDTNSPIVTRSYSIMLNGVEQAGTVINIVSPADSGSVTGLSIAVNTGDTLTVKYIQDIVDDLTFIDFNWGIMYNPATDGESVIGGFTNIAPSTTQGVVQYVPLWGSHSSGITTTESDMTGVNGVDNVLIRSFRVDLETAPGASNSRRFRIRKNGSDANSFVTISDTSTTGTDSGDADLFNEADEMSLSHEVLTAAVNNTTRVRWSAVMYMDPSGGAVAETAVQYNTGTNGKITAAPLTNSQNVGILNFQSVTANRTYTYPDRSGNVMLSGAALTSGRVVVVDSKGDLSNDGDLTFDTDTLTATKILTTQLTDTGLTVRRIPFAGTNGLLQDDADMAFQTDTFLIKNILSSAIVTENTGLHILDTNASHDLIFKPADDLSADRNFNVSVVDADKTLTLVTSAVLDSGTYTPTLTNVANLDYSNASQFQYLRVGNTVSVSGGLEVNPALTVTSTQLGISLPISSDIGASEDVAGTAFCPTIANQGAAIIGDATNNRAQMQWVASDVTSQSMFITFSYQVI